MQYPSGTGFSREEAGMFNPKFCSVITDAFPAKAGPTFEYAGSSLDACNTLVGPASAGKRPVLRTQNLWIGDRLIYGEAL